MADFKKKIQELLDKGYREISPGPFDHAERAFQKRIDDSTGKKYFITVYYSRLLIHDDYWESLEYDVQFNTANGTINLKWFAGYDVDKVEEEAELLWKTLKADYYEKVAE